MDSNNEYYINDIRVSQKEFREKFVKKCKQLAMSPKVVKDLENKLEKEHSTWVGRTKFYIKRPKPEYGEWRNYDHKTIL